MTGRLSTLLPTVILIAVFTSAAVAPLSLASAYNNDAVEVEVMVPRQLNNARVIPLSGSVEASQRAQISSLESGTVASINVEIGDTVEKGQVLLSLDNSLAKLAVEAAKASLQASRVNFAETQRLYNEVLKLQKKQVVPETLISERAASLGGAQADLSGARANLALQEILLARHVLEAPFAGVIAMRNTEVGEWLNVQEMAFELVNTKDLRVNLAIAQEYYNDLAQSPEVKVKIQPDSGGAIINASLSRVIPVSNSTNRSFLAQIDLPPNSGLIAGMSVRAEIALGGSGSTEIMLPRSAIKQHPDGGSSIFIAQNGVAKRLITSYRNLPNNNIAVRLSDPAMYNNRFVITGVELLKDGDRIITTEVSNGLTND